MSHSATPPSDLTLEEAEAHLDRLALEIEAWGDDGEKLLPAYKLIESWAEALRDRSDIMSQIRARAQKSKDQKSAQFAKARLASS
jgi:hypothetical protein